MEKPQWGCDFPLGLWLVEDLGEVGDDHEGDWE